MDFLRKLFNLNDINKATREGNIKRVREMLKKNPSLVNSVDKLGFTPLHWAVSEGNTVLVKVLLAKGAKVNAVEFFGHTPLRMAVQGNYNEIIKLLKSKGAVERIDISKRLQE